MANRDLFSGGCEQRRRDEAGGSGSFFGGLVRRLLAQSLAALVLFGGVVYLYEQESALGEGVRYIVALATADNQTSMAVNGLGDIFDREFWEGLRLPNVNSDSENGANIVAANDNNADNADNTNDTENMNNDENAAIAVAALGDNAAADYQPDETYLAAATLNDEGNLLMILPTSGLMQAAFGDIDENGLEVLGLEVFCQKQQEIKAAAIGEVSEVAAGERIVLKHKDGVETCYVGDVQPQVQKGDILRQGQVIGTITDATLLFQVFCEGEPVDPFLYVKGPK
jgi:hypothetical protein